MRQLHESHSGPEAGHALLQVLMALLVLSILASVFLPGRGPDPDSLVRGKAQVLRTTITAALEQAEATGGEVVIYADPRFVGETRGRFIALAGPSGVTRDSFPQARWTPLTGEVLWGRGTAETGPLGDSIATLVLPGAIRCSAARGCSLGGRPAMAFYLTHLQAPFIVYAVVLTEDATVHLYHYAEATRSWKAGSRR